MRSTEFIWNEIRDDLKIYSSSVETRLSQKCDTLSYYDLLKPYDVPSNLEAQIEELREEVANRKTDFLRNHWFMDRYFRWLEEETDFDYDTIGILLGTRIDVEEMNFYARGINYKSVEELDGKLFGIFRTHIIPYRQFKSTIYKNRAVDLNRKATLPEQYMKILIDI